MRADVLEHVSSELGDSASITTTTSSTPRCSSIRSWASSPRRPRVRSTVLAIADDLTQDGLVLRYRVDATDTGFSGEEGTFTICSFWLVTALT